MEMNFGIWILDFGFFYLGFEICDLGFFLRLLVLSLDIYQDPVYFLGSTF